MSSFREKRYNKLFKLLREDIYNRLCNIRRDEDITGLSCNLLDTTRYYAVIFYFMIIYNDIANPFNDLLTWENYKEKYDFDAIADCVHCHNINLNTLSSFFMFEELIQNEGIDSQMLIDNIPNIGAINLSC